MILRRFATVVAVLMGFAATQLPEFVQQYRQRLGGAIDELSAIIARFDADSAQQGLTETSGIDRLHANPDPFVKQRGTQMQDNVVRLQNLRQTQTDFKSEGAFAQLGTFATRYDNTIAKGAFSTFQPAVPTTPEALGLGLFGFVFGGGVVHMTGRPLRRRLGARRGEMPSTT